MAFNFEKKRRAFRSIKRTLPAQIGNIARNHYLRAFREQGFTDVSLDPWAKRKTRNRSDRRTTRSRAILVNTGHLRRSIRVGRARFNLIEVGSYGVKYARYHNKGERPQPKRQFVGKSKVMNDQIRKKIRKEIKNAIFG